MNISSAVWWCHHWAIWIIQDGCQNVINSWQRYIWFKVPKLHLWGQGIQIYHIWKFTSQPSWIFNETDTGIIKYLVNIGEWMPMHFHFLKYTQFIEISLTFMVKRFWHDLDLWLHIDGYHTPTAILLKNHPLTYTFQGNSMNLGASEWYQQAISGLLAHGLFGSTTLTLTKVM